MDSRTEMPASASHNSCDASDGAHQEHDYTVGSLEARGSRFNPLTQPAAGLVLALVCSISAIALLTIGWFVGLPLPLAGIWLGLASGRNKASAEVRSLRGISGDIELLWRCPISTIGNTSSLAGNHHTNNDRRVPQDVLALTTEGIHLLSVVAVNQAGTDVGSRGVAMTATAQAVKQALDGVAGLEDFADMAGRKLDALVGEHGYLAVLRANPSNLVYPKSEVRTAHVYKRRFVSGYYFELQLNDGTVDRRDILVARAKRLELEEALQRQGYSQTNEAELSTQNLQQ